MAFVVDKQTDYPAVEPSRSPTGPGPIQSGHKSPIRDPDPDQNPDSDQDQGDAMNPGALGGGDEIQ